MAAWSAEREGGLMAPLSCSAMTRVLPFREVEKDGGKKKVRFLIAPLRIMRVAIVLYFSSECWLVVMMLIQFKQGL